MIWCIGIQITNFFRTLAYALYMSLKCTSSPGWRLGASSPGAESKLNLARGRIYTTGITNRCVLLMPYGFIVASVSDGVFACLSMSLSLCLCLCLSHERTLAFTCSPTPGWFCCLSFFWPKMAPWQRPWQRPCLRRTWPRRNPVAPRRAPSRLEAAL